MVFTLGFQLLTMWQTLRDRFRIFLPYTTGIWRSIQQTLNSISGHSGYLLRCSRQDLHMRKRCQLTGVHHARQDLQMKRLWMESVSAVIQRLQRRIFVSGCLRLQHMQTDFLMTLTSLTGQRRLRRCRLTGLEDLMVQKLILK